MVQVKNAIEFWSKDKCLLAEGLAEYRINEVEKNLGVFFPNIYRELIGTHNGGAVQCRCFRYFDKYKNELIVGSIDVLPLTDGEDSVEKNLLDPPEFFPKGLVPFADDGGGDLTCFDYRNCKENPPIVFWVCGDNGGEDVHFVANSFEEFIDMLYKPED